MDDREGMCIVETIDDLSEVDEGLVRWKFASVDQEVEKFSSFNILENKKEFLIAFIHVIDAHDIRMVHKLHHRYLAIDAKTLFIRFSLLSGQRHARAHKRGDR